VAEHNDNPRLQQARYWKELTQFRAHIEYLQLYSARAEQFDNRLSIILAVTSNGSIAGWAIWSQVPLVWGVLIALSQLINAIRPYLPYQKQKKALEGVVPSLEGLFLRAESDWFQVASGDVPNPQINNLVTKLKQQKLDLVQKHLQGVPLQDLEDLEQKAKERAQVYFKVALSQ
jgi:hypothetical protein